MNPSTALATVLVDELVRGGVREAVLSPGSRSAPLAFALHDADAAGRLRLHVRIDERSAAFLALGLAKASGAPAVVVTTSGTAVATLHPAVLEAHHAGVPLLLLTADRPPEDRGIGASQTTDQAGIFGRSVRLCAEPAVAVERPGEVAAWRSLAARAVLTARGAVSGDPGPVHVNVPFREPLVPAEPAAGPDAGAVAGPPAVGADGSPEWCEPLDGRPGGRPWTWTQTRAGSASPALAGPLAGPLVLDALTRTVVVAGDGAGDEARRLAEAAGWPLLAEPSSGARRGPAAVGTYPLLLPHLAPEIERVVVYGRPTLSRPVSRLLGGDADVVVVSRGPRWPDPGRRAATVAAAVTVEATPAGTAPAAGTGAAEPAESPGAGAAAAGRGPAGWLRRWLDADALVRKEIDAVLDGSPVSGLAVAREVAAALGDGSLCVVGSSNPVRDLDLAPVGDGAAVVLANRGLAGIDGVVSTAIGAALAHGPGPAYAFVGDVTFLHDRNGLLLGPADPRPDLTIVVVNDDGGGIFTLLEQGDDRFAPAFERVFGTPHGTDLRAVCAASGVAYERAADVASLRAALRAGCEPGCGLRVVEVPVPRASHAPLRALLRDRAAALLG